MQYRAYAAATCDGTQHAARAARPTCDGTQHAATALSTQLLLQRIAATALSTQLVLHAPPATALSTLQCCAAAAGKAPQRVRGATQQKTSTKAKKAFEKHVSCSASAESLLSTAITEVKYLY
jgi:hypothetical protein